MPTELEDLVEFLHHGNTPIRQIAMETLVPYSEKQPSIFKIKQLTPVKDLKLLVKGYTPIAKNALTILINISSDREVLEFLAKDDAFIESLLLRITNSKEPNADEIAMLLANMAKDDSIERLLTLKRDTQLSLSKSRIAIDQLMDCFVKGANGSYNEKANYDYLAYLFADLAKFPSGTAYLTTPQTYDSLHPLAKLLPFTTHASLTRRLGVSSALKNTTFTLPTHPVLLDPPLAVLPFILLPLASGNDTYSDEETDALPEELQLLDASVQREKDYGVLKTYLETLLLLTTTREGRDRLRSNGVYPVVRECHLAVEDDDVREVCERVVQVLMRDEEGEEGKPPENVKGEMHTLEHQPQHKLENIGGGKASEGRMITQEDLQEESSDDDDKIVDVF